MSHGQMNPALSACAQVIPSFNLLPVHHGHKKVRSEKNDGPVKSRWRYPEDGERMLVQLNNTAHNTTIILKMAVPKCVRKHHIRGAVWTMLIGAVEEAAEIGLNTQHVKVVPGHFIDPGAGWIFARVQPCLTDGVSCQIIETAVAIAQVEIVRIRF